MRASMDLPHSPVAGWARLAHRTQSRRFGSPPTQLAAAGLRQAVRGGRDAFLAALDTAASAGRPLAERALSGDSGGAPALEPSRLAHLHLNWDLSVRCDWAPPAPGTAEALTGWAERASGGAESWAPGVAVGASGKWWARPGALEEAQRAERAGPSVSGGGGADRGGDSQADAARGFLLESRRALAARACTFVAVRGCVVREGPAQRSEEAAAEALIGELERMGVSDNDAHAKSPLGRLAMGRRLLRWLLCASRAVGRVAAGLEGGPGENDEGSAAEERREAVAREASSALEALSQVRVMVCASKRVRRTNDAGALATAKALLPRRRSRECVRLGSSGAPGRERTAWLARESGGSLRC